jgi:hypothetical protein
VLSPNLTLLFFKCSFCSFRVFADKALNINSFSFLMLISAFDGVVSSNQGTGLVEEARSGVSETLNKSFDYLFFQSIEHISIDPRFSVLFSITSSPQSSKLVNDSKYGKC